MNRFYRLVWCSRTDSWVPVPEMAKSGGRPSSGASRRSRLALGTFLSTCAAIGPAFAAPPAPTQLPTGGQVVAGSASISQSGSAMTVTQSSQKAVANWQTFNVGSQASVTYQQPSAGSVMLNRILDSNPSQIYGQITANGQVFFTNPNGLYFAPGSNVSVGGLVATTHSISDADFMAGKYLFSRNGATGTIDNEGNVTANLGGYIAMLAPTVINNGVVVARMGTVALETGDAFTLQFTGNNTLANILVTPATIDTLVRNGNAVRAPGGLIVLSAQAASDLQGAVVNNTGALEATTLNNVGGRIVLNGSAVVQTGTVTAGAISVNAGNLIDAGAWDASAATNGNANGGTISVAATGGIEQTAAATMSADGGTGGTVSLAGGISAYLSGTISASGSTGAGGMVSVTAPTLTLAGATIHVDGASGGGTILIGGGWHGLDATLANADTTYVGAGSTLTANATRNGNGGSVVLWSQSQTSFVGAIEAKGGPQGGNGGQVEVSSGNLLAFAGTVATPAPNGTNGSLLLDPANLNVESSVGGISATAFTYANPTANDSFGAGSVNILANGDVLITNKYDSTVAANAGAVRLYTSSGVLISTLTGSNAGDSVGSGNITTLNNGNYVVTSPLWGNGGTTANALGAATWFNGSTGLSGIVSASNSLVGSSPGDSVGSTGVYGLSSGNYFVKNLYWGDGGTAANALGAVTWGSGTAGVSGTIDATNSLVGSSVGDRVGNAYTLLSNGNYVILSTYWGAGGNTANAKGAVTWASGTAGVTGVVSAANSLVGSSAGDLVGSTGSLGGSLGFVSLSSGNYVVVSGYWGDGGTMANAKGAVTWGSGTAALTGVVAASNSLVGSSAGDFVGSTTTTGALGVTTLSSGNYVVRSPFWGDGGTTANAKGAVTWASGTAGVSGTIDATNSLVGSVAGDRVANGQQILVSDGNYLILSPNWNLNRGAVTWESGTAGVVGTISAANSLVGSSQNDSVGSGFLFTVGNGNVVVQDQYWNSSRGEATWINMSVGIAGTVSAANSLVGGAVNDLVGYTGYVSLSNGNYLILSSNWSGGKGAVTWGNGTTGVVGTVDATNSLVGASAGDKVGYNGANATLSTLSNGSYVVISTLWGGGKGAATWGDGNSGVSGVVSASNSLVGSATSDAVGSGGVNTFSVSSGGAVIGYYYLVLSPKWTGTDGAVTWGSGTAGVSGAVSAGNSLVGSSVGDSVGSASTTITTLSNGNYVVIDPKWGNGGTAANGLGSATWGSATAGVSGVISAANSLVGSAAGDSVGSNGVARLGSSGNYLVLSPLWGDGGTAANAKGAVTWGSATAGISGVVSAANSLVGGNAGDSVGSAAVSTFANGNYLVRSPLWGDGGTTANALGAVTWGSATAGISGVVSAANSVVGSNAGDSVGGGGVSLNSSYYLVESPLWGSGGTSANALGAVTWGNATTGVSGAVSATNSLVGGSVGDAVGSYGVSALNNGNYIVISPNWGGGGTVGNGLGAVTWVNGSVGIVGTVSAGNSLVGSNPGDSVGSSGIYNLTNYNFLVKSPLWGSGGTAANAKGAVTWASGTAGITGVLSAANSLVGSTAGDSVGSGTLLSTAAGGYVVVSPRWNNGGTAANAGAATWCATTCVGTISSTNSFTGTYANDSIGSSGLTYPTGASYVLVKSPYADASASVANSGSVVLLTGGSGGGGSLPLLYATNSGANSTVTASQIVALMNAGTSVKLQASNDLTVDASITSTGNGALELDAGRSILLNAGITSVNGNLTITANDTAADGVVNADRASGTAAITMAGGTSINVGSGAVTMQMLNGAGNTYGTSGEITLRAITAGSISAVNSGGTGGVTLASGALTASGIGKAIVLAGQDFVNNAGASALSVANGNWLIYSANPGATTKGGLTSGFRHYSATYASYAPGNVTESGNGFIYASAPGVLSVAVTLAGGSATSVYGNTPTASYGYTLAGFADSEDNAGNIGLSGSAAYAGAPNAASHAGAYTVTYGSGLTSGIGYTFAAGTGLGATVTQRPLTLIGTRAYDGTIVFGPGALTASNLVGSDCSGGLAACGLGGSAGVASKNVGAGQQSLILSGLTLGGAIGGDYTLIGASGTGLVTPLALTGSIANGNSVSGSTLIPGAVSFTNVIAGDNLGTATVVVNGAGNSRAGTYTETVSALSGPDAANYSVATIVGYYTVNAAPNSGSSSAVVPPPPPPPQQQLPPSAPPLAGAAGNAASTTGAPLAFSGDAAGSGAQFAGGGSASAPSVGSNSDASANSSGASSSVGSVAANGSAALPSSSPPSSGAGASSGTAAGTGPSGISISLVREPSVQQSGIINVSVPKEVATSGTGFAFGLPDQVVGTQANAPVTVTTASGQPLPGWLKYVPETKSLSASAVPDGAFPMQVIVTVGGKRSTIVISEKDQ